ncbi:hypothetical protein [Neobacillus notoginsengisoli]|uniref:hypothetical protein n=1 Tax=Neobacillus notoginsengisoli TaxID=1578198 RepID=UPI0013143A50|nr:hypothetical protein [Neobacillus notoginsengisoli]
MASDIVCLKDTKKSSIWKLSIRKEDTSFPLILKILPSLDMLLNKVELHMYQHPPSELTSFFPGIFHIEPNVSDGETWILVQYVSPVRFEWKMSPAIFERIIPVISLLHAKTHEQVYTIKEQSISEVIPIYKSKEGLTKRKRLVKGTRSYLEQAIESGDLQQSEKSIYKRIINLLSSGPVTFPELETAGHSIIHGDLHMRNICLAKNPAGNREKLLFIDWESTEYTSGWFDLGHLVGVLIEFRPDWQKEEADILKKCITLYTSELKKHGIVLTENPIKLYKMAYVQRILDRWLHYQLRTVILKNSPHSADILIPRYLDKLDRWGKELHLF